MSRKLEYWINPETREERVDDMTYDLRDGSGSQLTTEEARVLASGKIDLIEKVAGRLIASSQDETMGS